MEVKSSAEWKVSGLGDSEKRETRVRGVSNF